MVINGRLHWSIWKPKLATSLVLIAIAGLLLFTASHLSVAQASIGFSTVGPAIRSNIQQTASLTTTGTYTYFLPTVFLNYTTPSWTALGPQDVTLQSFTAIETDTLYVGASDGIYQSKDLGQTWSLLKRWSCGVREIVSSPITPSTLFIGTCIGPYRSTDKGLTWEPRRGDVSAFAVSALAVDPQYPQTLYAGTYQFEDHSGNVYKTQDSGSNWVSVLPSRTNAHLIVIDNSDTQTVYVASNVSKLLKTTEGGATWIEIQAGLGGRTIRDLTIDSNNHQVLYVATDDGIFQSIDAGTSWVRANTGSEHSCFLAVAAQPVTPTVIYAAAYTACGSQSPGFTMLYQNMDGGQNWIPIPNSPSLSEVIVRLRFSPTYPRFLFASSGRGIWKYGPLH